MQRNDSNVVKSVKLHGGQEKGAELSRTHQSGRLSNTDVELGDALVADDAMLPATGEARLPTRRKAEECWRSGDVMATMVRRGATAAGMPVATMGTRQVEAEEGSSDYDANDDGSDGADSSAVARGSADAVRVDDEAVL